MATELVHPEGLGRALLGRNPVNDVREVTPAMMLTRKSTEEPALRQSGHSGIGFLIGSKRRRSDQIARHSRHNGARRCFETRR